MASLLRQAIASTSRSSLAYSPSTRTYTPSLSSLSRRALATTTRRLASDDALSFPTPSPSSPSPTPAPYTPIQRPTLSRTSSWTQATPSSLFPPSPSSPHITFPPSVPPSSRDAAWSSLSSLFTSYNLRSARATPQPPHLRWRLRSYNFLQSRPSPSDPSSGRSVFVRNSDISAAYRMLTTIIKKNGIARSWRRDGRYEPRSVTRYKTRAFRHRARFAENVKAKVQLVQKIMRMR